MARHRTTVRLAVAGGGTGGHTYPALTTITAVREQLAEHGIALEVTWYGTKAGLEAKVAAQHGIGFRPLAAGKVRRSLKPAALARTALDLLKVPYGIAQAAASLARHRPHVVLSTGGYVAVPVGLAAALTRRRLVMHEQITTLGLANRLLARVATDVALSHPSSLTGLPARARRRATVTGNPIRPVLLTGDAARARERHGLEDALPTVYVTGGAQGAAQINRLLAAVLPELLEHCQILHQTGPDHLTTARTRASALPPALAARYHPVGYVAERLEDVYAAADLVIARSGAGTLAELTALAKPAVLIPLVPTAGHEQQRGAETLADAGAAVALVADQATEARLLDAVLPLLKDPARRAEMAARSASLGKPDAARRLAALVINRAGITL
ncbi:UDP-N-acetylglucosamine--N-acetylmuramyl-(pentapeptide) pyrophosphoryl-undecaprenol N-acetylglucosamine transferase [Kitasatospora sp. NPDC089509]|uniref:UDP-N-acetylglucosamine--N-acetylmuramyl- (pentapeptide) pyrophosphoryl-undecaprenol N-acetylglucosamine transferase n=1 Tax=Kitasatospora sp. NPDC089509 TaxID=3364079 RepID=UPI00381A429C